MKTISIFLFSIATFAGCTAQKTSTVPMQNETVKTIYDFSVESLNGSTIHFADFRGKKILIVNTASKCGYTPQYADLQKLYDQYKNKLMIVGFPANNFGGQEPGTNEEIETFCQKNYGVTFPMAAKISVKGENTAPIILYLTNKALNGVKDTKIHWNFTKFLIDENGKLIESFPSAVKPTDEAITRYLKN
jgi:glutathione peroxidase